MADRIPAYDELKLRLEPGADGSYRVLALGPDGSSASGSFTMPFSDTELENFVLRVGLPRRSARAYRSSQMEEAKRFGTELFGALVHDDVGEVFRRARQTAETRERGLRVALYLTGAPELMGVPWEFVYERPGFLAKSIYTPVVRSLELKSPRPAVRVTLPLRVLAIASAPERFDTLDVADERRKLERALSPLIERGMVELRWLQRATLGELELDVGAPDEVHVLHYIGHGAYDSRTQGGILVFEDQHGGPHEVTGEELCSVLADERSLRLAVLNCCEGARSSEVDPFSGVASSLVECGIPAVVGMQFEITDRAAIAFAQRFYTGLAQGFPVDAALAQSRKAIFAGGCDTEFGTPVLFLRGADSRLFDVQRPEVLDALPSDAPPLAETDPAGDEQPHRDPPPRAAPRQDQEAADHPALPIPGYDELTAANIRSRLAHLSPADLKVVQEHERRGRRRVTIIRAIDAALAGETGQGSWGTRFPAKTLQSEAASVDALVLRDLSWAERNVWLRGAIRDLRRQLRPVEQLHALAYGIHQMNALIAVTDRRLLILQPSSTPRSLAHGIIKSITWTPRDELLGDLRIEIHAQAPIEMKMSPEHGTRIAALFPNVPA